MPLGQSGGRPVNFFAPPSARDKLIRSMFCLPLKSLYALRATTRRTVFVFGWMGLLAFATGCATAPRMQVLVAQLPVEQQSRAAENLEIFNKAWDLVNRKHYDPKLRGVDWEEAAARFAPAAAVAPDQRTLYRALNGMMALLRDSHTRALPPVQVEERRTQVRARTGFNMVRIEARWVVMEVLPESPAEAAGIKPGWIVETLNGEPWGLRSDYRPRVGEAAKWEFLDEQNRKVTLDLVAKRLSIGARQVVRGKAPILAHRKCARTRQMCRAGLRRVPLQFRSSRAPSKDPSRAYRILRDRRA